MIDYEKFLSRAGDVMRESAIRQMGMVLTKGRDIISFAPGYPAEDAFPWQAFDEIAHKLLGSGDGSVLQYGATRGYRPLRQAVVSLMNDRGIVVESDVVVVTTGSQQGLDLVARVLLDPGDVALLELPSYTAAITAFRNVGATLVGIRQQEDGIDLDHLDWTVKDLRSSGQRVKFLYLVPNFQNPTGSLISLAKRRAGRRRSHRACGWVGSRRPSRWPPSSSWQNRRRISARAASISASRTRPAAAVSWHATCRPCARTTNVSATPWSVR